MGMDRVCDPALVARVTEAVLARLRAEPDDCPRALLIGEAPRDAAGFRFVREMPYEAVVLGAVGPGYWLSLRDDALLSALLDGIPVYFDESALPSRRYRDSRARVLLSRLQSAERQLRQLGARPLPCRATRAIVTAEEARRLRALGHAAPEGAVFTPLARDIMEGKSE